MFLVSSIKVPLGTDDETALQEALRRLKVKPSRVKEAYIHKLSLDARKRDNIQKVMTVAVSLLGDEEEHFLKLHGKNDISFKKDKPFTVKKGTEPIPGQIYIAGFGPAGLFAAYLLAENGYAPIVLERGYDIHRRVTAVEGFWDGKGFDPVSNVQFGEGGAGTFSDGKLTTRISDPLCEKVLEIFHTHGAPEETLRKAKPHIGTDNLREVILSMRRFIEEKGGKVLFDSKLSDIELHHNKLASISVNGETLPAGILIAAIGHSARDTFRLFAEKGFSMESKPFSVGVRVEHLQSDIDKGLYGHAAGHPDLPPGEYQLSKREPDGRCVYTFCMCPGGTVVPAASEEGGVVTNGMSEYRRDGKNANAALVVSVDQKDFGTGLFDGVEFQRQLEQKAFAMTHKSYRGAGADAGHFLDSKTGLTYGRVEPSYRLGLEAVDLTELFPSAVTGMLQKGLADFGRKIKGYDAKDTILTGPETRTSSPVRILRDRETLEAVGKSGVYPCGEGAGYAGGIMSAAVDGMKVALAIMERYSSTD